MSFKEFTLTWKVKDLELLEDDFLESPKFCLPITGTPMNTKDYSLKISFDNSSDIALYRYDVGKIVSTCGNSYWNHSLTATRSDVTISVSSIEKTATDIFNDILVVKCVFKSKQCIFTEETSFVTTEFVARKHTTVASFKHFIQSPLRSGFNSPYVLPSSIPAFQGIETQIRCSVASMLFVPRDVTLRVSYTSTNSLSYRMYVIIYNLTESRVVSRISLSSPDRESGWCSLESVASEDTICLNYYIQEGESASRIKDSTDVATGELMLVDTKASNVNVLTPSDGTVLGAMHQLYTKQAHSDFTLKAGGKSFPVHKNILSVRSPVFEAMISNDMKEKKDNTVEVTDIDEKTMDAFLKYVYYEGMEFPDIDFCVKLYTAADKYEVSALRQECINYMQLNFSLDNVCNVLQLAHACNDEQLKQKIMDYVSLNWKNIASSPQFKQLRLDNLELAFDIMHEMMLKML